MKKTGNIAILLIVFILAIGCARQNKDLFDSACKLYAEGQNERALKDLFHIVKAYPGTYYAEKSSAVITTIISDLRAQAMMHFENKDYAGCGVLLEILQEFIPEDAGAKDLRDKNDKAIRALQFAVLQAKAMLCFKNKEHKQCAEILEKMLQIAPDNEKVAELKSANDAELKSIKSILSKVKSDMEHEDYVSARETLLKEIDNYPHDGIPEALQDVTKLVYDNEIVSTSRMSRVLCEYASCARLVSETQEPIRLKRKDIERHGQNLSTNKGYCAMHRFFEEIRSDFLVTSLYNVESEIDTATSISRESIWRKYKSRYISEKAVVQDVVTEVFSPKKYIRCEIGSLTVGVYLHPDQAGLYSSIRKGQFISVVGRLSVRNPSLGFDYDMDNCRIIE